MRDFSPQLGRAPAMGFWTLGPVLGSLVVSVIVSNSADTSTWQDQSRGVAGDGVRAPQPGPDRDRPGRVGADDPGGHRGVDLLRAQKGPVVQAVLADPTPVGSTTVGKVATAASENPTVTAKLAEIQQRDGPLLVALQKNPAVAAALAKAQAAGATPTPDQLAQIRQALGPAAFAILVKPQTPADLTYLQTTAPKALGAAEFAAISAPNPALQKGLATLQADGPEVQAAAADSPKQWRTQFLIGAAGQVVFIPLIFLMAGYWDPRKAKEAEAEHEALVEREMAKRGTEAEPATA